MNLQFFEPPTQVCCMKFVWAAQPYDRTYHCTKCAPRNGHSNQFVKVFHYMVLRQFVARFFVCMSHSGMEIDSGEEAEGK